MPVSEFVGVRVCVCVSVNESALILTKSVSHSLVFLCNDPLSFADVRLLIYLFIHSLVLFQMEAASSGYVLPEFAGGPKS